MYRVKEFGLYDEEYSVDWVYPFLGVFEWRSTERVSSQRLSNFNVEVDPIFDHCHYSENSGYLIHIALIERITHTSLNE